MKNILCLLGIHKWEYDYKESDEWFDYKKCKRCEREERMIRLVGVWREAPQKDSNK